MRKVRIARQARSEKSKKLFQIFRQGANAVLIASMAGWEEHLKGLVIAWRSGREHSSERQNVLSVLMQIFQELRERAGGAEDKGRTGSRTKEAQVDEMVRWKGEGKDFAKVGVVKGSSTVVWSLRQILLWFMLEAMSASFKMAKDADEAMSESSWTALA